MESDGYNKDTKDDKSIGDSKKGRKNNRKNFKKGKKGGKSVKIEEKTEQELVEEKNAKFFSLTYRVEPCIPIFKIAQRNLPKPFGHFV